MKVFSFFRENIIVALVLLYFVLSVLLKAFSGIDYLIPCLWKTFFGFECFGCGVTSSIIEIIKGNFQFAWEINKLTFLVLPLLFFYSIKEVFLKVNQV
tara:strand:- start:169 stop:462 length:294 start_codon:yes stop_codon:yes gene_type:complete